jgi:hypothetical protein
MIASTRALRGAAILPWALFTLLPGLAAPGFAAEPEWQVLEVPEDGFTVELPDKPQHRVNLQDPELFSGVSEHGADLQSGFAMISIFTFQPGKRALLSEEEILDLGSAMVRPDCRAAESRPLPGGPGAAREIAFACPDDVTIRYRLHHYGDRLYRLAAGGPRGVAESVAADRFFGSFEIVD